MRVPESILKRPGWRTEFAGAAAVGLILGIVGPFGSWFSGPFPLRVGYWVVALLVGTLVFGTGARLILARELPLTRSLALTAAAAAVLAMPFAAATRLVAQGLWPPARYVGLLEWYFQVLVIAVPLMAVMLIAKRRRRFLELREIAPGPPAGVLGVAPHEVLCLQMEDHYVRVHTAAGSKLVLATMRQAVATMKGVIGRQVHRSWWVADSAVAEILSEGRNVRLLLSNGVFVPVARSSVHIIRDAGWLREDRRSEKGLD